MKELNNELREELLFKIDDLRVFIYDNDLDLDCNLLKELYMKLEEAQDELIEENGECL